MHYVGIDAGASWIKAGLFSDTFELRNVVQVPSPAARGATLYFDAIRQALRSLSVQPHSVGLALPATFSADGTRILHFTNVKGLGVGSSGIRLVEALGSAFADIPYCAYNDAACAAFGEWSAGHGAHDVASRLLHLTWGTGVGTGFVAQGQLQLGWEGGHLPLAWEHTEEGHCNCGSTIDLEALIAVPQLLVRARQLLETRTYTTSLTLKDLRDVRVASQRLVTLAEAEDELAQAMLRRALTWLARALHSFTVIAQPTVVTVGGGIMSSEWLLAELRQKITAEASGMSAVMLRPEMVYRGKLGNDAGIRGAAELARRLVTK